jgi:hemerythrin-like metal-binding protein
MTWNTEIETGNAYIDAQHHMLVDLINKLSRVLTDDSADRQTLARTLLEIRKYAEFHFVSEENFMRDIRYPGLHEHEKLHSLLLSELGVRTIKATQHWRDARAVLSFLIDWLNVHIAYEDRKLTIYTAQARARQLLEPAQDGGNQRDLAA